MNGDDRVRFCGECKLHVYNLSAMSKVDAEDLIATHEGRLCIRYFQRADGTVITDDCSRICKAIRRGKLMLSGAASAIMMLMLAPFGFGSIRPTLPGSPNGGDINALQGDIALPHELVGKIAPPNMVMGEMAAPNRSPATQPATQPSTQPTTAPVKQAS